VPDHLVFGYCHGGVLRAEFAASLLALAMEAATPLAGVIAWESGPNIATARNQIVHKFLTTSDAAWLVMADTDMVFAADAADRLIAVADPVSRPVVGAFCLQRDKDGGTPYPTMFEFGQDGSGRVGFSRLRQWPDAGLVRVDGTGTGFLLMHRDALERVAKAVGDAAAPWFREQPTQAPLALLAEDLTFCLRCRLAEVPVHVHTGVRVGHVKPVMLGEVT
jgi:hypothetical protein